MAWPASQHETLADITVDSGSRVLCHSLGFFAKFGQTAAGSEPREGKVRARERRPRSGEKRNPDFADPALGCRAKRG